MSAFEIFQSIMLGLVEGLTEFLPISSTGHLIIAGDMLGYTGDQAKTFLIVIQLGAILAVCWHYRARLLTTLRGLLHDRPSQRFVCNLIIAIFPSALLGLALHKYIKAYLFSPITVAVALIVGGFIILLVERKKRTARIVSVEEMSWRDALKLGFAQAISLFPGVSRSGATIIGGLVFGLSRQAATEFSFFLAIPTMFLATGYDLLSSWQSLSSDDLSFFVLGFVVAFISALVAIRGLLWYVAHHDFRYFAHYRIVFGLVVLCYFILTAQS
ncbi:MAG: undecaprenyl-diphosphate phosphatase [Desulfobulbaceae bacterium]|nr:undecaprenyl-diphosphate phosphatase [Desulfobulbaceae bacterium]